MNPGGICWIPEMISCNPKKYFGSEKLSWIQVLDPVCISGIRERFLGSRKHNWNSGKILWIPKSLSLQSGNISRILENFLGYGRHVVDHQIQIWDPGNIYSIQKTNLGARRHVVDPRCISWILKHFLDPENILSIPKKYIGSRKMRGSE